ncbi:hypothetical protein, partial [Poseidonibacter sp.]|uniref:hypothetical protein n=1 Tax=Poseidonibacter sp. TaxID=2321188 RepID=UPI003C7144BF
MDCKSKIGKTSFVVSSLILGLVNINAANLNTQNITTNQTYVLNSEDSISYTGTSIKIDNLATNVDITLNGEIEYITTAGVSASDISNSTINTNSLINVTYGGDAIYIN